MQNITGTAEIYRPHYFLDENVVLVTFDYRLNIFGTLKIIDRTNPFVSAFINAHIAVSFNICTIHM